MRTLPDTALRQDPLPALLECGDPGIFNRFFDSL